MECTPVFAVLTVVAVRGHDVRLLATQPPEGLLPAGCHFTSTVPGGSLELLQCSDRTLEVLKVGDAFVVELVEVGAWLTRSTEPVKHPETDAKPGTSVGLSSGGYGA